VVAWIEQHAPAVHPGHKWAASMIENNKTESRRYPVLCRYPRYGRLHYYGGNRERERNYDFKILRITSGRRRKLPPFLWARISPRMTRINADVWFLSAPIRVHPRESFRLGLRQF